MSQSLPEMFFVKSRETGRGAVIVGEDIFEDLTALLAARPEISSAGQETRFARAINHFAQGQGFEVIGDAKAFETAYRDRIDSEDPAQPWQQGNYHLRDYGLPDFTAISAPVCDAGHLVFYVQDALVGLPYRVRVALDGPVPGDRDYVPLPLTPVDLRRASTADRPETAPVADGPENKRAAEEGT
jgi:hypothetical protein